MSGPDIKEIFAEALEHRPADRRAFIERRCAGDAGLLAALLALLDAHESAGGFLAGPTVEASAPAPGSAPPTAPTQIGRYRILERLGEGGFGIVYLAEQREPVQRRVALKLIKLGMDTQQVIARFEAERQALAMMDHPNVASVLDAGATETGRPYFVMELVVGEPITTFADKCNLPIRDRLELFRQVCLAVQHAHTKGIIHRDLKPSNVLVSEEAGKPLARVIDFGIAKATQSRLTEKTLFTQMGQLIGTPEYMSPEQAEGALDVDTRSDVYSLGVLLYELLTGTAPFEARELRSKAYAEIQRIIREVDPPRPSARLSTLNAPDARQIAAHRSAAVESLRAQLRRELEWIPLKAMRKQPEHRYRTAAELADDIENYLQNRPLLAAPESASYRVRKLIRRHRVGVTATVAVAAALIAGIIGTTAGMISASRQRAEAQRQADEARRQTAITQTVSEFQSAMLASADPEKLLTDKVTVLQAMTAAVAELDAGKLKDQPLVEAAVRETIGNTLRELGRYDLAEPNLRKALELREKLLPPPHADIARSRNDLATLLYQQNRMSEADALYRTALSMYRQLHPGDHADIARTIDNLASLQHTQGHFAEAESLYRESLAMRRRVLHAGHRDIGAVLNNLGYLLHQQARYADAEAAYREALAICQAALPAGHTYTATIMLNLGLNLETQTRFPEAEPFLRQAVADLRKALPAAHPRLADAIANLANLMEDLGRYPEAEALQREAMEIRRKSLPPNHPDIAGSIDNIASLLQDQDKLTDAEAMYREALQMRRGSLPPEHPEIALSLNNLASCLRAQRRFDEAEQCHREALAIRRKAFAPGHPEIGQSLSNLAFLLRSEAKFAESEPLFREALAAYEQAYGKDDWRVGQVRIGLGNTLVALGRPADAEPILLEAERIFATAQGVPPSRRHQAVEALVSLYNGWEKSDPGKGYQQKADQWKAKLERG